MGKTKSGDLIRVRGGKIQSGQEFDTSQIYTMPRPKLEHQCMYFFQKTKALGDAIDKLQNDKEKFRILVQNRDRKIAQQSQQLESQRKTHESIMAMVTKEKSDLARELERLQGELKNCRCLSIGQPK